MTNDDDELPENWEELDSQACFFEYVKLVRREWQAGNRELPLLFRPTVKPPVSDT